MEWTYGSARVRVQDGALYFEGSLSGFDIIPLRAQLLEFAQGFHGDTLTADLSKVEQIGHTGLSILDALRQALSERGIKLVLASPSEPALQMLVTTRLAQRFDITR